MPLHVPILLSRDEFREAVFARDNHKCVVCQRKAQDAHHLMERRLWSDGGYYVDNGVSVCGEHHIACETTEFSPDILRVFAGIHRVLLPPHLYADQPYDKWGNPILPNGTRLRGELFYDPSVQKVLRNVLPLFTDLVKYPRTHHVPWSEGMNDDDRIMDSTGGFLNQRVIVTEKLDGENTTFYRNDIHARSVDAATHVSQHWVKNYWSTLRYDIPEGWRICGENLYAKHSIKYDDLPSYFMGFSIWDDRNRCLSWDDTQEWFVLLGIRSVPVLYDGVYDEKQIRSLWDPRLREQHEGYVVRVADTFTYGEFRHKVGKFVRRGHVGTAQHWRHGKRVERNGLRETSDVQ